MQIDNSSIKEICNIAIEAGLIIKKHYKSEIKISLKQDQSPLTEADLQSNKFILKSLLEIDKSIPILSEESLVNWNIRKNWKKYWLVDPLDGTKEFLNQNGQFTVNIALIENNEPIFGIIYTPISSELFYAAKNRGSFKIITKQKIKSLSGSIRIFSNKKKHKDKLKIIGSLSHTNNELNVWLKNNISSYEIIKKGSSLKFCHLAEGKADVYPRFGPTSEWDIAAGHIILTESGGKIETTENKKILYNLKESVINPNFIATCNMNLKDEL